MVTIGTMGLAGEGAVVLTTSQEGLHLRETELCTHLTRDQCPGLVFTTQEWRLSQGFKTHTLFLTSVFLQI